MKLKLSPSIQLAALAYHKIGLPSPGAWETWYYIKEEKFKEQLSTVIDLGWTFISAAMLSQALMGELRLPEKSALITFDDAYRNVLDYALPVMQTFNAPGMVFVPTQYIGDTNSFDQGCEPTEPICDWKQLKELHHHGVSVESHGITHRAFSGLSADELHTEITMSKLVLEKNLEHKVNFISYPYGDPGAMTNARLQDAGYKMGFNYKGGIAKLNESDLSRVSRIAMGPDTCLKEELKEFA